MAKTKLTVRERILKYLGKDNVVDSKTLAKRIKANHNSVRRELGYLQRHRTVFSVSEEWPKQSRLYYAM